MSMRLDTLAHGITQVSPEHAELLIEGIASDSRQAKRGFLFAAIPGGQADGAKFAASAVSNGAVAMLAGSDAVIEVPAGTPVLRADNPRLALSLMAARFHAPQPDIVVAVTGTNGKTSVASFVRQLWAALGFEAASLGTIGVVTPRGTKVLRHTTPEPIELHGLLAELAKDGITHLALEASSHGLQQRRIDGVTLAAGAFTNISRDHLDYHATFEDYFTQKLRLFTTLLAPGAAAVIDMDGEGSARVADAAKASKLEVMTVGRAGETLRLVSNDIDGFAQVLGIEHGGKRLDVRLPLVGGFQAANALVAAGLVMATGANAADVLPHLETLQGARGRLDLGLVRVGPAGMSLRVGEPGVRKFNKQI